MTTIFISATSIDLKAYMAAVKGALEDAGYQVVTMANFGSQPETPRRVSLREVEGADWFVDLYVRRYGYIPDGEELSITEQEYHHARLTNKPVFAFIVDNANNDLSPGPGEEDDSDEGGDGQAAKAGRIPGPHQHGSCPGYLYRRGGPEIQGPGVFRPL